LDEGRLPQSESTLKSENVGREDIEGNEADRWSAPAEGHPAWDRLRPPTLSADFMTSVRER